ncbi:MAG: VWA domain-containing protein [Acidimicrobiia bacterium]
MTAGEVAAANLAAFTRALREGGFAVTPTTTRDLVEAARIIGLHSGGDVRAAFASLVVTRNAQQERFNEIFDQFFSGGIVYLLEDVVARVGSKRTQTRSPSLSITGDPTASDTAQLAEIPAIVGGSHTDRLADVDFADLSDDEAAAVAKVLEAMVWSPSSYRSRRFMPTRSGTVPDMRRTLREVTGPRSDMMPLSFMQRRPRQRRLVVIADISGSMERYSEMLLYFVHGAHHRFASVESFVFATRLTRITRQLRRRDPRDALADISHVVDDWSGGTRIGEAIGAYNRHWAKRIGGRGPIVLIISDGWDTGDPDLLSIEMRRLARSAHRVIWLNPLAGHHGFTPEARGMTAAFPFVDDLLAGGTARNLIELVNLLQSDRTKRRSVEAS